MMFAIGIAWGVSAIITAAGGFDEGSPARTDSKLDVLNEAKWIRFPYPGLSLKSIYNYVFRPLRLSVKNLLNSIS